MKYPKVIIIIFLAISFKAFANPKDSLIYLINTFKSTTEKIKAINALCEIEWLSAKYDTATILINQAFALEAKELALNSKNQIILLNLRKDT